MAKITLPTIGSGYATTVQLNTALDQIEAEFQDKVLYRDNPTGEPNFLLTDVDCNGKNLLNVGTINGVTADALGDLSAFVTQASDAAVAADLSALAAADSANASATSAISSANSAADAAGSAAAASVSAGSAAAYASVGFDVASTIYDFGFITDAVLTFTTDYGSVV